MLPSFGGTYMHVRLVRPDQDRVWPSLGGRVKRVLLSSALLAGAPLSAALAQAPTPADASPSDVIATSPTPPSNATSQGTATAAPDQPSQQRAASDAPPPASVGEVVVTADSYANSKTIAAKRTLNVISDGLSANQIGELPEFGLGDAIASIPGVNFVINNGRGEDQFLTIRGLNPDYDSVTVDGIALPSTEETTRSVSFDVLPASVVNQVNILKTWTVDQPSDAVGGVTDLRTRSAFDHPGTFISGQANGAYWTDQRFLHSDVPSGEGDFIASKTFGPQNEFGALLLLSYYQRDSSTVNTYTLPYSYYPTSGIGQANVAALDQTSATASNTTLKPSQNVAGMIPIPDRHQWYVYDNVRTRPGLFSRFDFDDHRMWHAHLDGGIFRFKNEENRYSQYLNRVGDADITSATTGTFAEGSGQDQYDKYIQYRELAYVDFGVGATLGPKTRVDFTADYGYGHYRQNTDEDAFVKATSPNLAFGYNLATEVAPLFTPVNEAYFVNPANYLQSYHLNEEDQSSTTQPIFRLDFSHNFDPADTGLGFSAGAQHRDLTQTYSYNQYEVKPISAALTPTLAQIGTLGSPPLYDGYGQSLLTINPSAVEAFIAANAGDYARNATDLLSNTVNNYALDEQIDDGYIQADYRTHHLFALLGLRYEATQEKIENFLPQPFSSTTNFVETTTQHDYDKLLPSLNVSYTPFRQLVLRGAVTRTLARPEYSQLAQNSSASISSNASGGLASESISNPNLKPRESTNYDVSIEAYPAPNVLGSVALFKKEISNEIITLTTTEQGATIPGSPGTYALTITQPQNANRSMVEGVELNLVDGRFTFLPGFLSGFGARGNIAFMSYDAPDIRMSDGTFRHLPQLTASVRSVANAAIFYSYRRFIGEIAYNHTGKQPISFDTNNAVNDQWWAAIDTIDAQLRYVITPHLDLRFQAKNLGDATPQKVVGPNQGLNYSTLENGRAFFFGVGFHY